MLLNNFPIQHNSNQYVAKYNCLQIISWQSLVGMILFAEEDHLITNGFNMFIPAHNIPKVNAKYFCCYKFGIIIPSITIKKGLFLLEMINVLMVK